MLLTICQLAKIAYLLLDNQWILSLKGFRAQNAENTQMYVYVWWQIYIAIRTFLT